MKYFKDGYRVELQREHQFSPVKTATIYKGNGSIAVYAETREEGWPSSVHAELDMNAWISERAVYVYIVTCTTYGCEEFDDGSVTPIAVCTSEKEAMKIEKEHEADDGHSHIHGASVNVHKVPFLE